METFLTVKAEYHYTASSRLLLVVVVLLEVVKPEYSYTAPTIHLFTAHTMPNNSTVRSAQCCIEGNILGHHPCCCSVKNSSGGRLQAMDQCGSVVRRRPYTHCRIKGAHIQAALSAYTESHGDHT